jgi:hypothetical protein
MTESLGIRRAALGKVMKRIAQRAVCAGAAMLLCAAARAQVPQAGEPERVIYPSSEVKSDDRGNYYISLLKLVLSKADIAFDVQPSGDASGISRAFARMATGRGIDVMWAPPTQKLDEDFLRIRIPLDKGILGWRLFLINSKDEALFAPIRSLDGLKQLQAGQVNEWVDTDILRANDLPVIAAMQYVDLFRMLAADRFHYLPRGVGEIQSEARAFARLGLKVEPRLALHYPMCAYFFVALDNTRLAKQIELGLQRSLKDGSMERLFQQFNGPALQAAGMSKRVVLELDNPLAPAGPGSGQNQCLASSETIRRTR